MTLCCVKKDHNLEETNASKLTIKYLLNMKNMYVSRRSNDLIHMVSMCAEIDMKQDA
jgi:hypothetical protein